MLEIVLQHTLLKPLIPFLEEKEIKKCDFPVRVSPPNIVLSVISEHGFTDQTIKCFKPRKLRTGKLLSMETHKRGAVASCSKGDEC